MDSTKKKLQVINSREWGGGAKERMVLSASDVSADAHCPCLVALTLVNGGYLVRCVVMFSFLVSASGVSGVCGPWVVVRRPGPWNCLNFELFIPLCDESAQEGHACVILLYQPRRLREQRCETDWPLPRATPREKSNHSITPRLSLEIHSTGDFIFKNSIVVVVALSLGVFANLEGIERDAIKRESRWYR